MIHGLIQKLKNYVRFGKISNTKNDNTDFPSAQVTWMKKVKDLVTIYPYGFSANAPVGELVIIVNVGHEDNAVAFPASGKSRQKNLAPGEVAVGNFSKGTFVKFDSSGNVIINGDSQINGNAIINGNLMVTGIITSTSLVTGAFSSTGGTITGSISATGDVSAAGISLSSHTHGGVTTGGGSTGGPQ